VVKGTADQFVRRRTRTWPWPPFRRVSPTGCAGWSRRCRRTLRHRTPVA